MIGCKIYITDKQVIRLSIHQEEMIVQCLWVLPLVVVVVGAGSLTRPG